MGTLCTWWYQFRSFAGRSPHLFQISFEQYWPLGGIEAATKPQVPIKTGTRNGAIT